MKKEEMSKTEYLLRVVCESERMPGWNDDFSKMRQDVNLQIGKEAVTAEDPVLEDMAEL